MPSAQCLKCARPIPDAELDLAQKRGPTGLLCCRCRGTRIAIAGVSLGRCLSETRATSIFEAVREPGAPCRVSVVRSFGPVRADDLEREGRRVSALRQRGVLRLLGVGVAGDGVAGEYVWWAEEATPAARTLAQLLGRPLEPRWSTRTIAALAGTLSVVKAQEAASIDPGAITIDASGDAFVSAFSPAPFVERDGRGWAAPEQEKTFGMLAYMPPEQIEDATSVDERSVVYRLGAFLHHMLSGEMPFTARTNMDFFMKILNEPPPRIERADAAAPILALARRCMAKKREDRFESLKELAAAARDAASA